MSYQIGSDGRTEEQIKAKPWEQLPKVKDEIIAMFNTHCTEYHEHGMERFNKPEHGWVNKTWQNSSIRRCHVDVVDVRETKKLWMMHVTCLPNLSNPGPIYGFDVIAGKNKVTGAFLDYSPLLLKDHPMTDWFVNFTSTYEPSKKRELPEWALKIFSKGMVAAGNVTHIDELDDICKLAINSLDYYLRNISEYHGTADENEVKKAQNYYAENQRKNPHTPRVMQSLGLPEEDIKAFCRDNLFPSI